jgi:class 3 adenylate cyclase/tetratricopeptide (TPR) repeat protein
VLVCGQCGRENADDARFCSGCGAKLIAAPASAREERKIVTVLFADLVGFTAKAERLDPEDVRATLSPYYAELRSVLERHGGTVEKFIGDAVMAVFGAPVAHEDDPERAVRAALAIREAIAEDGQLQVRIAVTTGEALVSLGARASEGEGIVAGDVVNTAARLQTAAPVNGILVDEVTRRATRQAIDYREADPVEAKGKSEPVQVWEAREARSRVAVDVAQEGAPLVGRGRELDFLRDALARAKDERSPQLVTLVGVPGIGKSRLVYELSRAIDAAPELITWRQGRSLPYGDGATYWALAEMAKAQAGILETDAPEEAERKLAETVSSLVTADPEAVLENLRPLVGLGGERESQPNGDRRAERFAAWRQFFEALAEQRPAVLVFEDLHWAGDDLLDFVDHLIDWGGDVPLLVACTARPELLERRPGWGGGKPNALTLSISPLSDDETARLLVSLLDRAVLPVELQTMLLTRAGGNPLYAEQFARLLAETGWSKELSLPENVQGIIAARLDGLPVEEKQLLQDAAVLGKIFWLGAVSAVGGRDRSQAAEALQALVRKEFLRRERRSSVGEDQEYAFRHVLVRDVAYGQIPRAGRAERHERSAAWIESLGRPEDHAEMLAHHYLEALRLRRAAGQKDDPELVARARVAARDAGDRALALGGFPAAARLYEAALRLWPADDKERPELLLAYGRSRVDDVGLDDSVLEDAAAGFLQTGNREAAAQAGAMLGAIWLNRGDRDKAFEHLESAFHLVENCPPSPEKAYVLQELSRAVMVGEDFERTIALATESLRLAEEFGLDAARSRNLNTLGVARIRTGDPGGIQDLEQAVAIAAAVHSHEELSASANLTWMTALLGDVRRAGELHERARVRADELGLENFIRWQRAEHVYHCHWEGRWEEAQATADEFIREVEAGSPHYMESACRHMRGGFELARGNPEAALAEAVRGTEVGRLADDPQSLNPSLAFEARARMASGERERANALADELLERWSSEGVRPPHESVDGAWTFRDLDRSDEFAEALGRARSQTPWHDAARRIANGDLGGAAEVYREIGSIPDEAFARLRAAEDLARAGNRAEADRQLRLALPVFVQLGATAWAAEAEGLLAESA